MGIKSNIRYFGMGLAGILVITLVVIFGNNPQVAGQSTSYTLRSALQYVNWNPKSNPTVQPSNNFLDIYHFGNCSTYPQYPDSSVTEGSSNPFSMDLPVLSGCTAFDHTVKVPYYAYEPGFSNNRFPLQYYLSCPLSVEPPTNGTGTPTGCTRVDVDVPISADPGVRYTFPSPPGTYNYFEIHPNVPAEGKAIYWYYGTEPPVTDVCPNIAGSQATIPQGMVKDSSGNCVSSNPPASPGTNPHLTVRGALIGQTIGLYRANGDANAAISSEAYSGTNMAESVIYNPSIWINSPFTGYSSQKLQYDYITSLPPVL